MQTNKNRLIQMYSKAKVTRPTLFERTNLINVFAQQFILYVHLNTIRPTYIIILLTKLM